MGVFRNFPYSNFHEMNMDEIIKITKNMLEEWAQYHAEWETWMNEINDDWSNYQEVMNEAWQNMQDFINNYFDNLDVQVEINNKITSMVNTGEFADIVEPYIPPRVSAWLSEHITQPVGVVIDTSLTVAGACADAKATGDAIAYVQRDIIDLPYSEYHVDRNTDDKYLDANGDEQPQVGWSITDYLRINHTATYYIKTRVTSNAVKSCFYDENKTFISAFKTDVAGYNNLIAPVNAVYVRFSVYTEDVNDFKYSSTLFVPYEENVIVPELIFETSLTKTFADKLISGSYYNDEGNPQNSTAWSRTVLYPVHEGDEIIVTEAQGLYAVCYDENKTFVSYKQVTSVPQTATFIVENGTSFIGFNIVNANLATYNCTINGRVIGEKYKILWLEEPDVSIWTDKKYISHGDSITWQDGRAYIQGDHIGEIAKGYQTIFSEAVGLAEYINMGKSGWSMAVVNDNGIVNTIIGVADYSSYNLCTIACGTNDFKLNVPLGTLGVIGDSNFDDTTFYGAFRKAVEYILNNSPTIRLVLMTPLQRNNSGYDVNYINSAGHKLIDYVNAVKSIGEMYGLPVCDMYSNSGFTQLTFSTYTMDGLHPNDVGYKRMGDYLTGFLNTIGN